jgi:hypothetical protein
MAEKDFRIGINLEQIAKDLNTTVDLVYDRVRSEAELLSVSTHAFIIKKAQAELEGYKLKAYLGEKNKNVRWIKVNQNLYVVEVSDDAGWIEEGRSPTFMGDWLLKPGAKGVKQAADGSFYRVIPLKQLKMAGGEAFQNQTPAYETMIKSALRENKINLRKIEKDEHGNPKLGVLHKIDMDPPGSQSQFPDMYSMPRTKSMAKQTGLQEHGGIYHLSGLAVTQKLNQKGKVERSAVTFRVISSKHKQEGRWMYPQVEPFGGIKAAHEYATKEWAKITAALNAEFNGG